MEDCLFCKIVKKEEDSKVIYEDDLVMAILDAFPNVSGHTLIIPKKHYTDYKELPDDLILHINKVTKELSDKLENVLHKNSVTYIINYMDAQIVKHFHKHVVPGYGKKINYTVDEVYKMIMES